MTDPIAGIREDGVFFDTGILGITPSTRVSFELTPDEAVNLASALLEWASSVRPVSPVKRLEVKGW